EPYDKSAGQSLALRGSDNQRAWLLTPLARERYSERLDQAKWSAERKLDFFADENEIWMAGIPRPGDMGRLRRKLEAMGYSCVTSDQSPPVRA
ncbi:MAG: radical SAM protein, partial [Limisphaerales bacterium]